MGSMSIICITAIVGLGAMGVGYGYWTDSLNIGIRVTTGNINQMFLAQSSNEELSLIVSPDGRTLSITGKVLPNSDDNIIVKVVDNGSIPSVFSGEIKESTVGGILEMKEQDDYIHSRYYLTNDDVIKTFEININPNNDNTMMQGLYLINEAKTFDIQEEITDIQSQINRVEEEIKGIQNEINRLNITEEHEFIYELQFEQGI